MSAKLRYSRSHLSNCAGSSTFYVQLPRVSSVSPAPHGLPSGVVGPPSSFTHYYARGDVRWRTATRIIDFSANGILAYAYTACFRVDSRVASFATAELSGRVQQRAIARAHVRGTRAEEYRVRAPNSRSIGQLREQANNYPRYKHRVRDVRQSIRERSAREILSTIIGGGVAPSWLAISRGRPTGRPRAAVPREKLPLVVRARLVVKSARARAS